MAMFEDHDRWQPQPGAPALPPDEIHLWRFPLVHDPGQMAEFEALLSPDELRRADRFKFPNLRVNYVAAHGCLRDILGRYLHTSPAALQFENNDYNKPFLTPGGGRPGLEFNLTHSKDLGLLAVGLGRDIGVDVEFIRVDADYDGLVARFFSPIEIQEYFSLPAGQRSRAFFSCWVRKEAFIKGQGQGLLLPLDQFDVTILPEAPASLRATRPDPAQALQWKLYDVDPARGYTAALAVAGEAGRIQRWHWQAGRF